MTSSWKRKGMEMELSTEFWIQILVYLVTLAAGAGAIVTRLKYIEEKQDKLEKKQDKHNNLIERMVIVEQSTKSAHHRLDELEGD